MKLLCLYLGIIPGSVSEVLSRFDKTNINSTADTTGMAEIIFMILSPFENLNGKFDFI